MNVSSIIDIQHLKKLKFQEVLKLIVLLFTLQIILILVRIPLYVCLGVCVLIYLYKKNLNEGFIRAKAYRPLWLNLIFFLLVIAVNLKPYTNFSIGVTVAYLLFYALLIQVQLRKQPQSELYTDSKNIIGIFSYFRLFSILSLLVYLVAKNSGILIDFNLDMIILGVSFFCIVFGLVYLLAFRVQLDQEQLAQRLHHPDAEQPLHQNCEKFDLECDHLIAQKIIAFYKRSDLYLDAQFNLIDLARELGHSRAELSEVLNREMKVGFYSLTALYRIEYAKKAILQDENLPIHALMRQSGFHSKTTFNKYFKAFVGVRPSVFREQCATAKNSI
ncbi:helix-turn-helix domain-containing protein [Flavobacterium sp. JP2137]|uniref:helix-turn-helix domain-containing protein n=1 Tax=Flavobacterium sp. JP2137 TaxID=3414510 RepID=UPI003D2FD593